VVRSGGSELLRRSRRTTGGEARPAGGDGGRVVVWDTKTGKVVDKFTTGAAVQCLGFIRDPKTVVAGTRRGIEAWAEKEGAWAFHVKDLE
jgi:hypothetical protein